ncbi:MAG: caspase family protein [Candidatus Bathyarchaeia archaeon]
MIARRLLLGLLMFSFLVMTISATAQFVSAQKTFNLQISKAEKLINGDKAAEPRTVFTFTGSVSRGYDSTQHSFTVPSGTGKIEAKLTMPSGADFDLSMWDNLNRRTGGWTRYDRTVRTNIPNSVYSGVNKKPEWVNVTNPVTTGTWKVGCYAYSGSGSYTITVTVTPSAPDTTPPTLTITSPANGATLTSSSVTVTWTGSDSGSGISYYEARIDGGSWINKGTSTSHTFTGIANGQHTVDVRAWDVAGNSAMASVMFYVNVVSGVTKYAVIVGISDYKAISDLSYCDEDATDWYYHLVNTMGFTNVYVYGDGHTANFPKYDGKATEYTVKQALINMVNSADSDDIICFISSGHGSGNGAGSSFLCMWDYGSGENGENGALYDTELAAILDDAVANKIFVFLDHCYSGGFGPELMAMPNKLRVYLTTTCTANGYGYDDSTHKNGAWTYYFLEYTWINYYGANPNTSMETIFSYALAHYPYGGGDTPQQYDGNTSSAFYLT